MARHQFAPWDVSAMSADVNRSTRTGGRCTLTAFMDLAETPLSFDVANFMILSELERLKQNCDSIHFVLVPIRDGSWSDDEALYTYRDQQHNHWRIHNLVMPMTAFVPAVTAVSLCESRDQAKSLFDNLQGPMYPPDYRMERPENAWTLLHIVKASLLGADIPSLRSTGQARDYVRQWIDARANGRKVIAITLREASFQTYRNSQMDQWIRFAKDLDQDSYYPVFVRDVETFMLPPGDDLGGLPQMGEATASLLLRMALYEEAYVNLMTSNGPAELCWFNGHTRYLFFNAGPTNSPEVFGDEPQGANGIALGTQPPFATPYQKWIWELDDYAVITREFGAMVEKIEANPSEALGGLALTPKAADPAARLQRADLLTNHHRPEAALEIYESVATEIEDRTDIDLQMALCESKVGDADAAIERLRQYDDHPNSKFRVRAGDILAQHSRHDEAIAAYRRALSETENSPDIAIRLAMTLQTAGRLEEAEEVFMDLVNNSVRNPRIFEWLGELHKMKGNMQKAQHFLLEAVFCRRSG